MAEDKLPGLDWIKFSGIKVIEKGEKKKVVVGDRPYLIEEIEERLRGGGILSGYTIIEKSNGQKSLSHHEYEFKSKEDLMRFFTPHFNNVKVFETIYPSCHNLYFYASDGMLPFDDKWEHVTMVAKNSETAPT